MIVRIVTRKKRIVTEMVIVAIRILVQYNHHVGQNCPLNGQDSLNVLSFFMNAVLRNIFSPTKKHLI